MTGEDTQVLHNMRKELDEEIARRTGARADAVAALEVHDANKKAASDVAWAITKRKLFKGIGGLLTTLIAAFATWLGVAEPSPAKVEPADVSRKVVEESKQLREQVNVNTNRTQLLGAMAVEQQTLTVETTEQLGLKLDAISPEAAAIGDGPALTKAKADVKARKKKEAAGELFKQADAAAKAASEAEVAHDAGP